MDEECELPHPLRVGLLASTKIASSQISIDMKEYNNLLDYPIEIPTLMNYYVEEPIVITPSLTKENIDRVVDLIFENEEKLIAERA